MVLCWSSAASAQDSTSQAAHPTPSECYRFAFGAWSTPLDWKSAGHARSGENPESSNGARGDASRTGTDTPGDIVLYPAWWPVGVYINLDSTRTVGDTLFGIATAFVANGRAAVPTAPVRAFRVRCGLGAASSPPPAATSAYRPAPKSRNAPWSSP